MKVVLNSGERIDDLQLKDLSIIQNTKMFCFGIDAVLLSTFAKVKKGDNVLDLCTGNGIIPILLSGKTQANSITGVEIQKENIDLFKRSIDLNKLNDKVKVIESDINELAEDFFQKEFQVVTVNPPYMIGNHGLKNDNQSKTIARHELYCTLDDIIRVSSKSLKEKGRFYMIHRPFRLVEIFTTMTKYKLEPKRIQFVHSKVDKEPSMVLIEGIKGAKSRISVEKPLIIYNHDGTYTEYALEYYGDMKNI